jgi:polyphosphate kinase 2 (PPK2 family)
MKLQEWVIKNNKRVAIVFEGRDSAGKGSTIKRFIEYLNPKGFRVVALGVPTPEEKETWFARYEEHIPKKGEIVVFDRSWYNRAVVEPAMGYCTEEQYTEFMEDVLAWEEKMIKKKDLHLIKFLFLFLNRYLNNIITNLLLALPLKLLRKPTYSFILVWIMSKGRGTRYR